MNQTSLPDLVAKKLYFKSQISNGEKQCKVCHAWKPLDHFPKHPQCTGGVKATCRICQSTKQFSTKKCEHCGTDFVTHLRNQKYCSESCKNSARIRVYTAESREKQKLKYHTDEEYRQKILADQRARNKERSYAYSHKIGDYQKRGSHVCWIDGTEGGWGGFVSHIRIGCQTVSEKEWDHLSMVNAGQAWKYWLKEKAPVEWCEKYYAATGKPWNNPRLSEAEKWRIRYSMDEKFVAGERIKTQFKRARKKDAIGGHIRGAVIRGGTSKKVELELGYTIDEFCANLEKKFKRGMTWEKFKAGEIHIDHIIPQAYFDLTDENEWRTCWSLNNLQPLWAKDNIKKSDKLPANFNGVQLTLL